MGRNCGWLTAATARVYRERAAKLPFLPSFNLKPERKAIDAVYVPELAIDIEAEGERLRRIMDAKSCVSVFVSEGANAAAIVEEMLARGEEVKRDAFGHVQLDKVNVGEWLSRRLSKLVGAERTLVQKSGYFARSAAAGPEDRRLIREMAHVAVECGLSGEPGLVGNDEERGDALRAIEFTRIRGGKPFDLATGWFREMLAAIGQPPGAPAAPAHADGD
jgi:pyrophosphate--fructose-6-phosphate 1-phosphotransferase